MAFRTLRTGDRRFIFVPEDIDEDKTVVLRATTHVRGTGERVRLGTTASSTATRTFTVRRILRDLLAPSFTIDGPDRILEFLDTAFFAAVLVPEVISDTGVGSGAKLRRISVDSNGSITDFDWLRAGTCYSIDDRLVIQQPNQGQVREVLFPFTIGIDPNNPPIVNIDPPRFSGGEQAVGHLILSDRGDGFITSSGIQILSLIHI